MAAATRMLLFALCSFSVQAKVATGVLSLDSMTTELYVTKFSFSSGAHGTIGGEFVVPQAYLSKRPHWLKQNSDITFISLQVALYNQEKWDKYHEMIVNGSLCLERLREAVMRTNVPLYDTETGNEHVPVAMDHEVTAEENSHYWYAIVADCSLEEYDAHPPTIEYTLEFKNGGGHLPADEDGMLTSQIVVLIGFVVFFVVYSYQLRAQYRDFGQVHLAVVLLGIAAALQMGSIACEVSHLYKYTIDGKGLRWRHSWLPLDFVSEVLQGLSELLISFVLIALAFGWTIVPQLKSKSFADAIRTPHLWFSQVSKASVFIVTLAIFQLTLEVLGRGFEDDFNQFHDHEHWPGYTLMFMRICLSGVFLFGVYQSRASERSRDSVEVAKFFSTLRITGSIWFAAFPLVVFLSAVFPPYRRHAMVTIGAIVAQMSALVYLLATFLTRRAYFKISSMSNMGTVYAGGLKHGKICVD